MDSKVLASNNQADSGAYSAKNASRPEYVIDILNLSKVFRRNTRVAAAGYTTLKSTLFGAIKRISCLGRSDLKAEKSGSHTVAIKDLTLRIPRGSSVGIIGRNGSGKSTFLKLVTGIYKPTSGSINVSGRVAALIELGAGFHPDFTGRENLYLAGIMHGLTRHQIEERFDDIVAFAELSEVIDDPVRTYSSGMFMRLGFSIAVHTDPDILLVDEVLAVGDAGFVAKCKDRIAELRKAGKTLLLVTHDLESVERWCDEVVWIDSGEVKERGYPRRVIDAYRAFVEFREEQELFQAEADDQKSENHSDDGDAESTAESVEPILVEKERWGSREIEITSVELLGGEGTPKRVFHPDDSCTVSVSYLVHAPVENVVFGIGINRADGLVVYGTNTDIDGVKLPQLSASGNLQFVIDRLGLQGGAFTLDVAVHRVDGYSFDYHKTALSFSVRSALREAGVLTLQHSWMIGDKQLSRLPVYGANCSDQPPCEGK